MQVKHETDFKCVLNMNLQINLPYVRPLTVKREKLPLTCCLSQLFWCLRFPSSKDVFSYGIMIMTHLFGRNQEWHRKGFTHMYTSWKHSSVNDLAWHWEAPLLKISSIPNSWRNQEWYREGFRQTYIMKTQHCERPNFTLESPYFENLFHT